jgi:hypothetical protein
MGNERRRFIRFPYEMRAELLAGDASYRTDTINNISIGGCLFPAGVDLETGTPCVLRIMLGNPGAAPVVTVEGIVVRSEQGNVAIKFTKVDPENLHHLQKIARYNSSDPDRVDMEIHEHPGLV